MEPMIRVETVLDSWKTVRQDTAQAVEEFAAGELDFKIAPDVMSFRDAARHILDAGNALAGLLLDGEENLATPDVREKMKRYFSSLPADADPAALAAELRQSMERLTTALAAQPAEFFSHLITRMDGQRVTRLEMVQFAKEHEMTHRAQLFLCLRCKGMVPATTRRRQTRPAAK